LFKRDVVKVNVNNEEDWNGRCETPVGEAGQVRPRRSDSDEEAQRPPHGKRVSWSGNPTLTLNIMKNSLSD